LRYRKSEVEVGEYTGLLVNVRLRPMPSDQLDWLRWICAKRDPQTGRYWHEHPEPEFVQSPHPFFLKDRRSLLFRCQSAYFPEVEEACRERGLPELVPDGANYALRVASSIKNYDNEIETFVEWIGRYVIDGEIRWRYEHWEEDRWQVEVWR
jgi:hypothetical protein